MEAVAAQLYVEMLRRAFAASASSTTCTMRRRRAQCRHRRDGRAHRGGGAGDRHRPHASAGALCAFRFGGLPPNEGQRRSSTISNLSGAFLKRAARPSPACPSAVLGMAPHSLRAVTPEELSLALDIAPEGPVHIHVAEQTAEVDACLAWSGARPVEWLLDNAPVDGRWCLIHATHMTERRDHRNGQSGAVAGLFRSPRPISATARFQRRSSSSMADVSGSARIPTC